MMKVYTNLNYNLFYQNIEFFASLISSNKKIE
jgi:hypothetical protein